MRSDYDIAIIGAGDVGAAIARELARFELRIALFDSGDVGAGTSKANTALLHVGFDSRPGTLEARLLKRGQRLLMAYAAEVGIPVERTGALLVAWTPEELARLSEIDANARACGYEDAEALRVRQLYRREPHLGPGALGALAIPDEAIICPWTTPLAFATQAVLAGVELRRFEQVLELDPRGRGWELRTSRGRLSARWVVNAAGLHSDEIDRMAGFDGFTVTPRRGELIVFDKLARGLVSHVVLPVPVPGAGTRGVMIAPTVFGNVLVGPTADDLADKRSAPSSREGIDQLLIRARRLMPALLEHEVTAIYAGLRAATEHQDYQLKVSPEHAYVCAGGIRSTGLSSSMAIAEWVRDGLADASLDLQERPEPLPSIRMANIGEAFPRPYQDAAMIAADPAYGEIVCFCERVTLGEIRDAVSGPIPPSDLDGLRRRTRALTGRCQGFSCGVRVGVELASLTGQEVGSLWRQGA